MMDRPRTDQSQRSRKRKLTLAVTCIALIAVTIALAALKPAVPTVDGNQVWVDDVRRGPMVRQVRALGTLVADDTRWIAARTAGRVEKILLRPGAQVEPNDVIMVLDHPEAVKAAADALGEVKAAEAELLNTRVRLQRDILAAESAAAAAHARYKQSKLKADVYEQLFSDGLISALDRSLTKVTAEQAAIRDDLERKRVAFARDSIEPQLAVKAAEIERLRTSADLRQAELESLQVKAGMKGVLQVVRVEIGAQVEPGANLARVADPARLHAEIRVAETQATAIRIGQRASIDTRNGVARGRVSRIDPSVRKSTVTVEVALDEAPPAGARPDLSVEGTVEIERLNNVLFVGRPATGSERGAVELFLIDEDGDYAKRTRVRLGRSSVSTIEIVEGLAPGDRIILSDMSRWDGSDRVRLSPAVPPRRADATASAHHRG